MIRTTIPIVVLLLAYVLPGSGISHGDTISPYPIEYISSMHWTGMGLMAFQGDYAFYATDHGFVVVNIADPANSFEVTKFEFPDQKGARDLKAVGDYLYCTTGSPAEFYVFDISDIETPQLIGECDIAVDLVGKDLVVDGNRAYVSGYYEDIITIDISVPSAPAPISTIETARVVSMEIIGSMICVGRMDGFDIYDISDPVNAVLLFSHGPTGTIYDFEYGAPYLYVSDGDMGVWVFDATDPSDLELVSWMDQDGYVLSIIYHLGYLYATSGSTNIRIYDVTDPTNPVYTTYIHSWTWTIYKHGDLLITDEINAKFVTFDISSPPSATMLGVYQGPSPGVDFAEVNGDHAFVLASGLHVYNISVPTEPYLESTVPLTGPRGIEIVGNIALIAGQDGFFAYDISDPSSPVLETHLPITVVSFDVEGDIAACVSATTLNLVDISDPSAPFVIGTSAEIYPGLDVALQGNYAYVTQRIGFDSDLLIFDISNPSTPQLVSTYFDDTADFIGLQPAGEYLYLSTDNYIHTLDISDPMNVHSVKMLSGGATRFELDGDYLYAASGYSGLRIYDVFYPESPQLLNTFNTAGVAQGIQFDGDLAVVADQTAAELFHLAKPVLMIGDANRSGGIDIDDVVHLLDFIFASGEWPLPVRTGDFNCDNAIDIDDVVSLIAYIFAGGEAPCDQ